MSKIEPILKPDNNPSASSKKAAIFIATLTSFIGPFMSSSLNVALPSIGHDFSMGPILLGWINTSFLLSAATFLIPFGRLGDLYGRKKIFIIGLFILLISSLLIANSSSGVMIIACRVLQGFASAMVFATVIPILMSVVPANERGRALGIATAAVYFGLSGGPFLGGLITQHLGWRYIFWLNIPLSLALLALTHFTLKGDWAEGRDQKFDLIGGIILGLGLFASMYGFSTMPSIKAFIVVVIGLIVLTSFAFYELRIPHPMIDIRLFRHNIAFTFSNLSALINYAATFAVSFLLSLYLQKIRLFSPQTTGLILVCQPIVQAIFSPVTGHLSDRIEPRILASLGMAFTLIGLAMLTIVGADSSLIYIIICLIILGFGFALFSSPNTNAVMSSVDRKIYGVANATLSTMRQTGMMFSMGIVLICIALFLGEVEITTDTAASFLTSMRVSFGIFAILCFGGIFASLARGNINRSNNSK
jgi:EmrB/QacA subfamily drug resistance transporter